MIIGSKTCMLCNKCIQLNRHIIFASFLVEHTAAANCLLTMMFKLLQLLVGILVLWTSSVFAAQVDVDIDGNTQAFNGAVDVYVINTMDEPINIIWFKGLKYNFIMEVQPDERKRMTTYEGHTFYCTRANDEDNNRFFDFEIEHAQDEVYVADDSMFSIDYNTLDKSKLPVGASDAVKPHPRVTSLNKKSTSVGAKFKSLYPKPLDIW